MSAPPDDGERASSTADRENETTGLPGLRTWRAVYTVVVGIFILWVGLLTWLTERYS